jgi:hypothetical protein
VSASSYSEATYSPSTVVVPLVEVLVFLTVVFVGLEHRRIVVEVRFLTFERVLIECGAVGGPPFSLALSVRHER